jgi:FtsP/CotA-like multicopper oxidase with cupredoxin domain
LFHPSPADRLGFLAAVLMCSSAAFAEPLTQPPVCSTIEADTATRRFAFCNVAPIADKPGQHELTLSLSATTSPVNVGGYRLAQTDNYNGSYLPPTVELLPGDRLKVRLVNALVPDAHSAAAHNSAGHVQAQEKGTNLHTHGLIVSPKNARAA